jgi:ferrochelatase
VEVSHHYLALGGVSPINSQNRALLAALKERLPERGVEIPIYLGNRNSEPYFADVLTQMHNDGHRKVLAWVTSAYSSYSGCRQYRENLAQALTVSELEGKMTIDKVRHYFDHPGFLAPIIEDMNRALGRLADKGIAAADIKVMFATHSIPDSMGESSGPPGVREDFEKPGGTYAAQHLAAATLAMAGLSEQDSLPSWELVYQSRSGAPSVPWLEPDVNDAIRTAKDAGKKAIVIVPIGFVSDHVEVIWDLDNEAKETCDELGLDFERVATSGTHSAFVEGIIDLIQERTDGLEAKALSPLGPWPSFCNPNCCPNLRKTLPVIAEG